MQKGKFGREFKLKAVKLVRDRGISFAQAARDLDAHENVQVGAGLRLELGAGFGHGQMKPRQQEIERLRREIDKLKAERNVLKRERSPLREGSDMKFVFIAMHRNVWPVAWLCDALGVYRSGFHARPEPLAQRQILQRRSD